MDQTRYRVLLRLKDTSALAGLAADTACMPRRKREDGILEVVAEVSADALKTLRRKRSVQVEVLGNATEEGKQATSDVSRGNRYDDGSLPVSLGLKEVRRVD